MSVISADTSYGAFHMPPPAFQYAQGSPSNMHPLMTGRNLSDSWAPSPGSSSDYSSCSEDSALSPATPSNEPTSSLFADPAAESQETWDLIPYNVPWGHEYCDYRPGVLPGPDGACIFLRSPTPLKNKRTVKACNKCRGRKAKCSGTRPACARCLSRGYLCQYDPDDAKDNRGPNLSRKRARGKATSSSPSSIYRDPTGTMSITAEMMARYSPPLCSSPKREEVDMTWCLGEPEGPSRDSASNSWVPQRPPSRPHSPRLASTAMQQHHACDASSAEPQTVYYGHTSPRSELSDVEPTQSSSSWIHAPRPIKYFAPFSPAVEDPSPYTLDPPQEDASASQAAFFPQEQYVDAPQGAYVYYTEADLLSASYSYEMSMADNSYTQLVTAYLPPYAGTEDYAVHHYGAATSDPYAGVEVMPTHVGMYEYPSGCPSAAY